MATTEASILQDVLTELKMAKKKSPWPDHPVACAGLVSNATGPLLQGAFNWKYKRAESEEDQKVQIEIMRRAAIETCVMSLRFLENL